MSAGNSRRSSRSTRNSKPSSYPKAFSDLKETLKLKVNRKRDESTLEMLNTFLSDIVPVPNIVIKVGRLFWMVGATFIVWWLLIGHPTIGRPLSDYASRRPIDSRATATNKVGLKKAVGHWSVSWPKGKGQLTTSVVFRFLSCD